MLTLIVIAVVLLAYSNGANDNFKGVATLFGSGTTNYRRALSWATITTFAGSAVALWLAHGLVKSFSGKGLVPDAIVGQPVFLTAVGLGAATTVLIATWTGIPISTTHALTGGLIGAGLIAARGDIRLSALATSFLVPLLCSPLISGLLTLGIYPLFRGTRRLLKVTSSTCVCVGASYEPVQTLPDGSMALVRTGVVVQTAQVSECVERYQGKIFGLQAGPALDVMHFASAGAMSFARGLNDTPKIVALLIGAKALTPNIGLALVAVAMAIGGILNAKKVAETMSQKITRMSPGQGFTANLVTSILVAAASGFGLPVSTTHVSCGALFGIGVVNGTARWRMILTILMAWVTTLPLAAAIACCLYFVLK